MPVRNISSIGSTKPIPIYVWIPPQYDLIYKIEIYDVDTATAYDVTDIVLAGGYTWGITETIGKFEFTIDNSAQDYLNIFTPYDELRVYLDYAATATTLRFKGIIERVSKKDFTLVLSGRGPAAKYIGKNVTYSATSTARSTILSGIISKYFSDLTTTNLESDTGTATVNYFDKPFWEVVEDICGQATFDAFVDTNYDFNYFSRGSRTNTTEAIVHEYNLIELGDFSPDASFVYNKIKVYGVETDGMPIIATANDTTSQTTYKVKELKINDSNITTKTQAQTRADYELALNKDPPTIGMVKSLGLPTLAPGQKLRISDPLNGLNPGYYDVFEFSQKFSNDEPVMTEVTIKKERTTMPNVLKKRIKFESEISAVSNPNEMDYSVIDNFDSDAGTHSSTAISTGALRVSSGSTGTWTSDSISLSGDLNTFEIRLAGGGSVVIRISLDGGIIYTQVPMSTEGTVTSNVPINSVIIKIELGTSITQVNTMGFFYTIS